MKVAEQMVNLKTYIEYNITEKPDSPYYNENFCNLVLDYFGSKGEFSEKDILYLHYIGHHEDDFIPEEYQSYIDWINK